ncbi:MAG TPA: Rne/Rng family ribonuclease [Pyrinomonadaceae bacterium]|jgi:ribonuclease G|nr:Rne/Rng family ribonuclease [Pyrinomonadaceae bacterium]
MAKQLIVSVNGREKKIAIIEDDKVSEFYIERGEQHQGIVGNIYKGRVMRVLPGMQSAFVDIGLERDAFLYVSDFFDEEEEFERIVIDKAKKGTPDAEHAAAEEVALNRVEREQRIELTQERVEPLQEVEATEATPAEEVSETQETGRRRGRRGRRRGRWEKTDDTAPAGPPAATRFEAPDTPFVAGDPSIERIVDEEETALNGEMFKDARLQERLFDQIHAVEFNMEDDFRNAEVGSILSGGFGSESFERIDDGETDAEPIREAGRPREAHLSTFIDDVTPQTFSGGGFERISDDEEDAVAAQVEDEKPAKRSRKAAAGAEKKKRASKAATKTAASKKKSSKKSSKKRAAEGDVAEAESISDYSDAEARVIESQSRGEFATRRGGRRRRRPSKGKPQQGQAEADGNQIEATNGQDDDFEPAQFVEPPEEVAPPAPEPPQRQRRDQRDGRDQRGERDQRGQRDQRSFRGQSRRERHQPAITDLLSEGQEILVQIAKEPIAKKGARITSHIALPGRFLVYMPTVEHVGVSRKIESDNERHRLRKLIQTIRAEEDIPSGGFIVRTAGVGISEKDLRDDVRYLVRTWLDIRSSAEKSKAPALVHRDLDLVQRLLRDQLSDDFESIRVDSEEEYQVIVEFINRIQPRLVKRVKLYTKEQPILEAYGVQVEIDKAIKPRVWLKSGGYLVINQTEALVAIDVNTGKFVGRGSGRLEDTITRTNLEAVDEIVRQIRLRDLGGIIVLDLIDMEERRNRQKVMQALQEALRNDKSPTKVLSFNDFGLVIMTRKRVKQSLERTLCSPCPYCQGAGLVKSPQTICYELLEDARRLAKEFNGDKDNKQVTLRINPDVAKALRSSERDVMIEIEDYLGPIDITSDPTIHQEQFDFAVT